MSRLEYEFLIELRPDLKLPDWSYLRENHTQLIESLTAEELIARRSAIILGCDRIDEQGFPQYRTPEIL